MKPIIFLGPPGTGKTTRLLSIVRDEIAGGVAPNKIAFVAFTRKAAREARERAAEELGLTDDDLRHWRTLHSTAARQLGRGDKIMGREHWTELGRIMHLDFHGDVSEDDITMPREEGGRYKHLDAVSRATRRPLRDIWQERGGEDRYEDVEHFAATLAAYKAHHGLLDYADLLDKAPGALPIDVAFIDEAQDLTPAQWDYAWRALSQAHRVYVAGDDDQALYDWAGGDVTRFLDLVGDRTVLNESHRLPRAVYDVAQRIVGRIRQRHDKQWSHNGRDGDVDEVAQPDDAPLWDGEWLLLARTRALLDYWEAACRDAGVPYTRQGFPAVKPAEALAIRAWETWRKGTPIEGQYLVPALEMAGQRNPALDALTKYAPADLDMPAPHIWRDAFVRVPRWRRLYYEACLRRDPRALTDPPKVHISTIHGAKGGEAQRVGLLTDITPRVEDGMYRGADQEHRVWYVGATRARESLTLVRPLTDRSYTV